MLREGVGPLLMPNTLAERHAMTLDDFRSGLTQAIADGSLSEDSHLVILHWAPAVDPGADAGWVVSPAVDVVAGKAYEHSCLVPGDQSEEPLSLSDAISRVEELVPSAGTLELMVRQSSELGNWDVHIDEPLVAVAKNPAASSYGVIAYFEGHEDVLGPGASA